MARKTISDRLSMTLPNGTGDISTIYGRLDTSDFIDPVAGRGITVHGVEFHLRNPNGSQNGATRTGIWTPFRDMLGAVQPSWDDNEQTAALKIVALNTAYQDLSEVGISTDGVYSIYEQVCFQNWNSLADGATGVAGGMQSVTYYDQKWSVEDLHGDGALLLSDLLIGVAVDNARLGNAQAGDITIELDVVLHFSETKVTQKQITQMLTANMDV